MSRLDRAPQLSRVLVEPGLAALVVKPELLRVESLFIQVSMQLTAGRCTIVLQVQFDGTPLHTVLVTRKTSPADVGRRFKFLEPIAAPVDECYLLFRPCWPHFDKRDID